LNGIAFDATQRTAFRGVRLVAFWDAWDGVVAPGFGASDDEREAIQDFRFTGPAHNLKA